MLSPLTPFNLSMHLQRCPPNPGLTFHVTPCPVTLSTAPIAPPAPVSGIEAIRPSGTLKLGVGLMKLGALGLAVGTVAGAWTVVKAEPSRARTVAKVGLVGGLVATCVGLVAAQVGVVTTGVNALVDAVSPSQPPQPPQ